MKRVRPIVAIDGPVGAGKSTVARGLAHALGFRHLNTGAIYRAVAIAAMNDYNNAELNDPGVVRQLGELLNSISIKFDGERVLLDGSDISGKLADPRVSDLASRLSALAIVREKLRDFQRDAAKDGGIVMEGRDIGTVIFPDAEYKFYLTAEAEARASRRYAELIAKGVATTLDEVLTQIRERDSRDQARQLAPLKPALDAIVIDSTKLNADQVVSAMYQRIQRGSRG
jgi:cytidylate kinase